MRQPMVMRQNVVMSRPAQKFFMTPNQMTAVCLQCNGFLCEGQTFVPNGVILVPRSSLPRRWLCAGRTQPFRLEH
jgi:hypothetical protein